MNWIVLSAIMFVSSIVYYLLVKKAQMNGIDSKVYMAVNFFVPSLFYVTMAWHQHVSLLMPIPILIGLILSRGVVNYFGSIAGYLGMKDAPNAGYSVIIQKGYSVFTAIAAVFLFGSELSPIKYVAIVWTILCAAALSIQPGKKVNLTNYKWLWYSLAAFFAFGITRLFGKYYSGLGVSTMAMLFWTSFSILIMSIAEVIRSKSWKTYVNSKENAGVLILLGLSVTSFYYFLQTAELAAPNIGYVNTISLGSNAVLTLFSALIFRDTFSWKRFFAVVGVCAGIIVLVI
jgi:drug/metabolite transporter (DMT)-like permease